MVEKGFNSDITVYGTSFHVQTEDWGRENPFLVSRIFRNGAVLKSIKTSYTDVLPRGVTSPPQAIRLAMKVQHESILDLLVSGQLITD
ncbi:MAG: hypothetical protein H6626_12480 [Pseudobdellovibrionaceae bacterium]|nr:hypothetical protein [Bdellovibrionales bacterium]USN46998.1 MAG: hypothetical protein H6626_12480 [Pseudobdellovibrionaceae bacterium]